MALWSRLGDGDRANKIFKGYLKEQSCAQLFALCGRAMQVDGTLGAAAAISEMLMQSHDGHIRLLPALPKEWSSGEFKGVCARGGFELDFAWSDGKVTRVHVLSKAGEVCRLQVGWPVSVRCEGKSVEARLLADGVVEFSTEKGKSYQIEPLGPPASAGVRGSE